MQESCEEMRKKEMRKKKEISPKGMLLQNHLVNNALNGFTTKQA